LIFHPSGNARIAVESAGIAATGTRRVGGEHSSSGNVPAAASARRCGSQPEGQVDGHGGAVHVPAQRGMPGAAAAGGLT
jgi:hypothetical protein